MSLVINDRVRETTAVTGTGSATLLGAVTGYQSFSVIGNGNTTYYTIADQGGANWEVGIGTYSTSGPTLARTTVLSSSNSGALVNFTAGTKDVFVTQPSEKAAFTDASGYLEGGGSYNIALNGNLGFNSSGARITGDFSNATLANRVAFQTSTTNSSTILTVIPNGTSTTTQLNLEGDPSIANGAVAQFINVGGSDVRIASTIRGTGTYLPLTMYTGGSERLRIDTSGNVGIGTNSPTSALVVSGAAQGVPTVNGVHIGTETGYATIELVGTSTTGSLIDFTQSGTDFKGRILYSNTDNHLELDVNGAEAMRITSAGYVGIAQAAPVTYLQVGTGVSNSANYIWAAGNSANPPSSATYGILLGGNLSGGNAESNLIWGQGISSSQYFNIGKWTGSAYTEQMRLSSGGNLSINTTATYNPLGVATPPYLNISGGSLSTTLNAANDWATFYSSTGNATYLRTFVFRNTASVGGWTTATTRIQQIIDVTNQGYIDFNPPGGNNVADIAFGYGSTEYMRINAGGSGYVGIGTTTPTNRFTVAEPTNNDATIYLTATQANRAAIINLNGTLSGYNFIYGRVNGTEDWGIGGGGGTAATLAFYTGSSNSERMRINSSGNVGIGTSAPAGKLHINTGTNQNAFFTGGPGYAGANGVAIASVNDANSAYQQLVIASSNFIVNASGGTGNMGIATNSPQSYLDIAVGSQSYNPTYTGHLRLPGTGNPAVTNTGGLEFIASSYSAGFGFRITASDETGGSTPLQFFVRANTATWTEGMRLTNSGNLFIGTTSQTHFGKLCVTCVPGSSDGLTTNPSTNASYFPAVFLNNALSVIGTISCTTSSTAYNTSSDYRLKENVQPMTGALATVSQLKPCTYDWILTKEKGQGFIAHELQAVVPDCVTGEKDAVDEDGKPVYQGIDTSFLVATLTAAIQEQQQIINDLTARIAKLEGK